MTIFNLAIPTTRSALHSQDAQGMQWRAVFHEAFGDLNYVCYKAVDELQEGERGGRGRRQDILETEKGVERCMRTTSEKFSRTTTRKIWMS